MNKIKPNLTGVSKRIKENEEITKFLKERLKKYEQGKDLALPKEKGRTVLFKFKVKPNSVPVEVYEMRARKSMLWSYVVVIGAVIVFLVMLGGR